jgi:hypothetical protein
MSDDVVQTIAGYSDAWKGNHRSAILPIVFGEEVKCRYRVQECEITSCSNSNACRSASSRARSPPYSMMAARSPTALAILEAIRLALPAS